MFWQVGPTFVGGPDWKMTKKHIKISPKFNNKILPMLKGSSINSLIITKCINDYINGKNLELV